MKKSFLYAGLALVASLFMVSCEKGGQTPETDSTKLWPACDAKGENAGYINETGNLVIAAMYDQTVVFSCGYGRAMLGSNYFFLDKNGKTAQGAPDLSDGCDECFYYNCVGYQVGNRWGMLDKNFNTIIQPAYNYLGYMSAEGLVVYQMSAGDKYGYLNKKGEIVITANFDGASMFEDGVAVVKVGGKFGAVDKSGQYVINAIYDKLWSVGEGRVAFADYKAGKGGMLDTKGNIVVNAIYDGAGSFADNGLCPVCQNDKWGYIDKNGNVKIALQYVYTSSFYEGYAWIKRADDTNYELIDTKGNTVLTLGKEDRPASMFHNGLARVRTSSSTGETHKYIDVKGKMVYSWTYEYGSSHAPVKAPATAKELDAELFKGTVYGPRFDSKK